MYEIRRLGMNKFLIVFYGFLFSLFCFDFCYASASNLIDFKFDHNSVIISPESINLAAVKLSCVGKKISDFYQEIAQQNNFIGKIRGIYLSEGKKLKAVCSNCQKVLVA